MDIIIAQIHRELQSDNNPISEWQIKQAVLLFDKGNTIPFIARYRKEQTGTLDEVELVKIQDSLQKLKLLNQRKTTILEQLKNTDGVDTLLLNKIENSWDKHEIEDLYLPYKPRRENKADKAIKAGLEPLARMIMAQGNTDPAILAKQFVCKEFENIDEVIEGSGEIIKRWFGERPHWRKKIRRFIWNHGLIVSKKGKAVDAEEKFKDYYDSSENLKKMPPHRFLAINRGARFGILAMKVKADLREVISDLESQVIKNQGSPTVPIIKSALKQTVSKTISSSIKNELLKEKTTWAEEQSVEIFAKNIYHLLMAAPLPQHRILAIDPAYRTGCKLVCINEQGDLKHNETIFPHAPQREFKQSVSKLQVLVNSYKTDAIAIGNGTASRETEFLVKKCRFNRDVKVFLVDESGASVYSASTIGRKEFPNYDVTVRGAVSIGRRLADPMAELVKIDPKAIGVGQYQHDINANLLQQKLDESVMLAVNKVGVNLNTASPYLLKYISGLGEKLGFEVENHRKINGRFSTRDELLKVKGLGPKAYEQAAGFLRIEDGTQPLDATTIHPESYNIVGKLASVLGSSVSDLLGNKEILAKAESASLDFKEEDSTKLKDIIEALKHPGRDPRKPAKVFEFNKNIRSISDLIPDMLLPGIITNIVKFGAFVDIGIKENGLIHLSNMTDRYISDPQEIVNIHQQVIVKVLTIDVARKRIGLGLEKGK
jgi:uncharacterized protein